MTIISIDTNHTCKDNLQPCEEVKGRKRNYMTKDIDNINKVMTNYEPTRKKEGNAKQLMEITKSATGFNLKKSAAFKAIREKSHDTLEAQIGQHVLIPSVFEACQHIWQFGDSSEMNGGFKIFFGAAKDELIFYKKSVQQKPNLGVTDMIPLINKAWTRSFSDVTKSKHALSDRGWYPLNRALLTNEALLKTKKRSDSSTTTTASSDSSAVEGERLDHGVLLQLNFDNGIVGDKLSQINSHRDNVAARQAVLDRAAAASSTSRTLDRSKKLTSGELVASNMYQLDEFVRDHQISVAQHNQEEAAKKEERKRTRDEKLHDADAAAARAKEEKDLTVKDLKACTQCLQETKERFSVGEDSAFVIGAMAASKE